MGFKASAVRLVFVLMAIGLVLPAEASALTIRYHGKALEKKEIPMSGFVRVESLGSGMECSVDATMFVNLDTVEITKFNITTETCVGFGSLYSGCKVETDQATLPWSVTVKGEELEIASGVVDMTLKSCLTTKNTITFANLRWHLVNWKYETKPIYTGWEFGGPSTVDTNFGSNSATTNGGFQFVGVEEGTYEIS